MGAQQVVEMLSEEFAQGLSQGVKIKDQPQHKGCRGFHLGLFSIINKQGYWVHGLAVALWI